MSLNTTKLKLIQMLIDTDDKGLLKDIKLMFKLRAQQQTDIIPQHVIDGVRKSQEQLRNGEGIPWAQVKKELDKI